MSPDLKNKADHYHLKAGVVTSAAGDWSLDLCTYPMSMIIASGGIAAAILGSVAGKVAKHDNTSSRVPAVIERAIHL